MKTINESPICDNIHSLTFNHKNSSCSSDSNLQNLIDLNANLKPMPIREDPLPNKFNLTILNDTDEYLNIKRNDSHSHDKEEKESSESNKLSNESGTHSGTTMAESTFSPVTPTYKCIPNDRYYYNSRKMSSPMCSYYDSSHKAIAELLDKNLYDYSKSNNYIEKTLITPNDNNIYYGYYPMMQRPRMFRSIDFYEKKEERKSSIKEEKKEKENKDIKPNHPVTPTIPLKFNTTTSLMNFSIFCNKNNNVNSVLNRKSNNGNENTKNNNRGNQGIPAKKRKPFMEREGDWVCKKCKNLNFAFRTMCNRCHLQKSESEKSGEGKQRNTTAKFNNNNCNTNNKNK